MSVQHNSYITLQKTVVQQNSPCRPVVVMSNTWWPDVGGIRSRRQLLAAGKTQPFNKHLPFWIMQL